MKKIFFFLLCFQLFISFNLSAQSSINRFLTPADSFNKHRTIIVTASWAGIYGGTLIGLNQLWYADYPHTSFHFFNDNNEWLQMDKVGHVYTSYFESVWTTDALLWSGTKPNKAAWIGAATGFVFQNTLEVFDGFSEQWGASAADVIGNALGASLSMSQYLLWKEQRIEFKFSSFPKKYPAELTSRTLTLFGSSIAQNTLKDYNGQTYWLSVNPSSFIKNSASKFPKWLNIDVGYGVDGLFGGYKNVWDENGEAVDRTDIARVRQFYLSPDIDFTRIKTKSATLKTFFSLLNIIKVPAPALEINSHGSFHFYPVYF
ncbi:MAG TPA: DUF2279 domain-containing protein [Chitinophagales bacterium]|nr:DUF2279 domain-containing protein [Chitinophagales bacterium]